MNEKQQKWLIVAGVAAALGAGVWFLGRRRDDTIAEAELPTPAPPPQYTPEQKEGFRRAFRRRRRRRLRAARRELAAVRKGLSREQIQEHERQCQENYGTSCAAQIVKGRAEAHIEQEGLGEAGRVIYSFLGLR